MPTKKRLTVAEANRDLTPDGVIERLREERDDLKRRLAAQIVMRDLETDLKRDAWEERDAAHALVQRWYDAWRSSDFRSLEALDDATRELAWIEHKEEHD